MTMERKYFNFNNEQALTPIDVDSDTGAVHFAMDGQEANYENVTEFAEFYAKARGVLTENLKNWTLTDDDDQYSFILKAGTAGITSEDIQAMIGAGMTPEEIGKAINASTDEDAEDEEPEETESHGSIVADWVNELTNDDVIAYLAFYFHKPLYSQEDAEALFNYLAEKDDLFNPKEHNDFEGDGEWDYEYTEAENFEDNIAEVIRDAKDSLKQNYFGLPVQVVLDIENDEYSQDKEVVADVFNRQLLSTVLAGRSSVPVTIVTVDDLFMGDVDLEVKHVFFNHLSLGLTTKFYYVDHKFYVVKDDSED